MTYEDDRTEEQKQVLTVGVAMTDRCLSGWGGAAGGKSVACWACRPDDLDRVERWVRGRRDATYVRVVDMRTWRPRAAHTHVYDVYEGHPALR